MASPLPQKTIYADFLIDFDIHPVSKDLARNTNENAIKQALRYLILTDRGERKFQPNVGGNIRAMLFENITPQTLIAIKQNIQDTIRQYEPRVNLIDVVVKATDERNAVSVSIVFNVINKQELQNLEVVLERLR